MKDVQVKSDRNPKTKYTVTLDDEGHAIACTCPAGENARACKHLYRAESQSVFAPAIDKLVEDGKANSKKQVLSMFARKVVINKGDMNLTIAQLIEAAFGSEHPLARVPAFPRTRGAKHVTCPHCQGSGRVALDSPSAKKPKKRRAKRAARKSIRPAAAQ